MGILLFINFANAAIGHPPHVQLATVTFAAAEQKVVAFASISCEIMLLASACWASDHTV